MLTVELSVQHSTDERAIRSLFLFSPAFFPPGFFSLSPSSGSFLKRRDCAICIISGDEAEDSLTCNHAIITRRGNKTCKQILEKIQSTLLVRHTLVIKYSFVRKHFHKCCYKFTGNFGGSFERKTVLNNCIFCANEEPRLFGRKLYRG